MGTIKRNHQENKEVMPARFKKLVAYKTPSAVADTALLQKGPQKFRFLMAVVICRNVNFKRLILFIH